MTLGAMRFKTLRHGPSDSLESNIIGNALDETEEEAREYDQRIKEEIRWKLNSGRDEILVPDQDWLPRDEVEDDGVPQVGLDIVTVPSSETTLQNDESDQEVTKSTEHEDHTRPRFSQFPAPSFRPSGMSHSTPKPLKQKHNTTVTSTFPQVQTPTFASTPQLPRPPVDPSNQADDAGPSNPQRKLETPTHIPSPIDTPGSFRPLPGSGEGRGRRDDPATPIPLGVEKFKLLKGKKDFQTLTRHFEVFSKQTERQKKLVEEAGKGKFKGKGKAVEVATLGGKVFEGLRFCFPPELGNTSKQKTHWDIVSPIPRFWTRDSRPHQNDTRVDCQKGWCGHVAA